MINILLEKEETIKTINEQQTYYSSQTLVRVFKSVEKVEPESNKKE